MFVNGIRGMFSGTIRSGKLADLFNELRFFLASLASHHASLGVLSKARRSAPYLPFANLMRFSYTARNEASDSTSAGR